MPVSRKIASSMENASWIRRMFETGNVLRAKHGADKVCDLSLGNPDVEPPAEFQKALDEVGSRARSQKARLHAQRRVPRRARASGGPGRPGAGSRRWRLENIVMSCGASGAMNSALKTILDPGAEVIASTPCFMEYVSYVDNHGGTLVPAPSRPDFDLDVDAIESRITARTAAVIINSPNNPTGRIYPGGHAPTARLRAGSGRAERVGHVIYLLSDEPYRKLAYGGAKVPGIMGLYPHSIVVTSYSKDLSLPGERIGFAAVNPAADDAAKLVDGIILCHPHPGLRQRAGTDAARDLLPAGACRGRGDLPKEAGPVLLRACRDGLPVRGAGGCFLHLPQGSRR